MHKEKKELEKEMNELEMEIIKTINKHGWANYKALEQSIKGKKFETIRRKAKDLVDRKIITTKRENDGTKLLTLTDVGKEIAKKLESNFLTPLQPKFQLNKLHFDIFLEGKVGFIDSEEQKNKVLGFDSNVVDLLGMDLEEKLYGLFIQRQSGKEGVQELFLRILDVKEKRKIKYLFIQIFDKDFNSAVEKFIERYFTTEKDNSETSSSKEKITLTIFNPYEEDKEKRK